MRLFYRSSDLSEMIACLHGESYPQGVAFSSARFGPAAYGAQWHCAAAGQIRMGF
jgi:hypothetical protein